ncbi:MAG: hypothetical protein NXH85_02010 [Pseudomonadaceae bacterium]|nr:hypothetical protein [Pseudomonadaceae bacterium]
MLLSDGDWRGRGSLVAEGQSLGVALAADLRVVSDDDGATLTGDLCIGEGDRLALSGRIAADEQGLYEVQFTYGGASLSGHGKLDSVPHLVSATSSDGHLLSVTLFRAENAIGCRGFLHRGSMMLTWEMALTAQRSAPAGRPGGNVVTLRRR